MDVAQYAKMASEEDHHWWFAGRREILRSLLATHLHPHSARRLLDVGCGTGGNFPLLAQFGAVEGADASPDAIRFAAERCPDLKIHRAMLPDVVPDGPWDAITAFDVIEHLDEPIACLRALAGQLAGDGQIVITVPAYQFLWSEHDVVHHHKRRYTRELLATQLAEAGLRQTYATHFNTLLLPAIAGVRLLQHVLPRRGGTDGGDLKETGGLANRLLARLFASERFALRVARLPAGVSIFAIAQRG